ncbi:hypothetical protein FB446DRAFT_752516 [Lentinula raphanica]|nr:hypothetical protein FB446DRAFT_752516 [Lentinula raphanica]
MQYYDYFQGVTQEQISEAKWNLDKVIDIAQHTGRFDETFDRLQADFALIFCEKLQIHEHAHASDLSSIWTRLCHALQWPTIASVLWRQWVRGCHTQRPSILCRVIRTKMVNHLNFECVDHDHKKVIVRVVTDDRNRNLKARRLTTLIRRLSKVL